MVINFLPDFIRLNYELFEWKHACAILRDDFSKEWNDLIDVLTEFKLRKSDILTPGGGKSPISNIIEKEFKRHGWQEKAFKTEVVIDSNSLKNPTHKIDCYKNRVALEIEWNNKDPFFDRDLNNFRLLSHTGRKALDFSRRL